MKKVYWAVSNVTQGSMVSRALYLEPEPIAPFANYSTTLKHNNFKLCPSFVDHVKNIYSLKFPIDYDFTLTDTEVSSNTLDQNFFNNFVFVRDPMQKVVSFNVRYVFFTEESLMMSLTPPYLETNELATNTVSIPGTFDIGQWFRTIDYSVQFKPGIDKITINRGDVYNYVHFHTNEPIQLIRFDYVDELDKIQRDMLSSKGFLGNKSPKLSYYYNLLKQSRYSTKILRLIKDNVL